MWYLLWSEVIVSYCHIGAFQLLYAESFICCTLAVQYNLYSMVGWSIACVYDLGGMFTSAFRTSDHIYWLWTSVLYCALLTDNHDQISFKTICLKAAAHSLHPLLLSPAVSCSGATLLYGLLSTTTIWMLRKSSFRRVSVLQLWSESKWDSQWHSLHWMLIKQWNIKLFYHHYVFRGLAPCAFH